jgi:cytochrome c-type biogenesis protein CcmF
MMLGTVLLIAAAIALLAALVASLLDLKERGTVRGRSELAVAATFGGFAALGAALIALAAAFLAGDVSIQYVWAHTDIRYTWFQRLSGLWVGRAGSILLWTGFALALWCIEEARHRRALRHSEQRAATSADSANPPTRTPHGPEALALLADAEAVRRIARPIALGVVLLMLLVVLHARPFLATSALELAETRFGRGMNPQLLVFYNAIHPPVVFLGYAATLLPTIFAFGHLATGRRGWLGIARRWAHVAFFTLTIGVALGALWAYIALGWGGYWDWDPVEVASLIPWLVVTAFLHAAYRFDAKGQFPLAAPILGALALAGSIFSTLVVRSGVGVSLHTFLGAGDAPNAFGRFLEALNAQWEVRYFTLLIAASILGVLALTAVHVRRIEARAEADPATPAVRTGTAQRGLDRALRHLSLGNLFLIGVLLLASLTLFAQRCNNRLNLMSGDKRRRR